jgi:hypothetical protein
LWLVFDLVVFLILPIIAATITVARGGRIGPITPLDWLLIPVSIFLAAPTMAYMEYIYVRKVYGFPPVQFWGPHLPGRFELWYFSIAGIILLILAGVCRFIAFLFLKSQNRQS